VSGFVVGGRSTGFVCWMAKPGCVDLGWARGAELRHLGRHQARHVGQIWPICFSKVLAKVVL